MSLWGLIALRKGLLCCRVLPARIALRLKNYYCGERCVLHNTKPENFKENLMFYLVQMILSMWLALGGSVFLIHLFFNYSAKIQVFNTMSITLLFHVNMHIGCNIKQSSVSSFNSIQQLKCLCRLWIKQGAMYLQLCVCVLVYICVCVCVCWSAWDYCFSCLHRLRNWRVHYVLCLTAVKTF